MLAIYSDTRAREGREGGGEGKKIAGNLFLLFKEASIIREAGGIITFRSERTQRDSTEFS